MAIFGGKKNTKDAKQEAVVTTPAHVSTPTMKKHAGHVLVSPRITEKGTAVTAQDAYVFNVARSANKREIAQAIEETFKVTVRAVRTVFVPSKKVMTRNTGRYGKTASGKKAYVYLKKGDKIDLI